MRSYNRVVTKQGVPWQVGVHERGSAEADTGVARRVGETGPALAGQPRDHGRFRGNGGVTIRKLIFLPGNGRVTIPKPVLVARRTLFHTVRATTALPATDWH